MATKRFKLQPPYDNFTGFLNNVYPIKEGVFTTDADKRDPKVLIEHYGAKRVFSKEEAEAAAKQAAQLLEATKKEEVREAAAKEEADKKAAAEAAAQKRADAAAATK